MLRIALHNRGADGLCTACGQPFPCPDGITIYKAVKRELEHPTPSPAQAPAPPGAQPVPVRWEDLSYRQDRCPRCLHWRLATACPAKTATEFRSAA